MENNYQQGQNFYPENILDYTVIEDPKVKDSKVIDSNIEGVSVFSNTKTLIKERFVESELIGDRTQVSVEESMILDRVQREPDSERYGTEIKDGGNTKEKVIPKEQYKARHVPGDDDKLQISMSEESRKNITMSSALLDNQLETPFETEEKRSTVSERNFNTPEEFSDSFENYGTTPNRNLFLGEDEESNKIMVSEYDKEMFHIEPKERAQPQTGYGGLVGSVLIKESTSALGKTARVLQGNVNNIAENFFENESLEEYNKVSEAEQSIRKRIGRTLKLDSLGNMIRLLGNHRFEFLNILKLLWVAVASLKNIDALIQSEMKKMESESGETNVLSRKVKQGLLDDEKRRENYRTELKRIQVPIIYFGKKFYPETEIKKNIEESKIIKYLGELENNLKSEKSKEEVKYLVCLWDFALSCQIGRNEVYHMSKEDFRKKLKYFDPSNSREVIKKYKDIVYELLEQKDGLN